MKTSRRLACVTSLLLATCIAMSAGAADKSHYKFDPNWPKLPLPNHWVLGGITGLTVDTQGTIWVLQRPQDFDDTESYGEKKVAECCFRAPAVIGFNQAGDVVASFNTADWNEHENHLIMIDREGLVWIGSDILRVYTRQGKLVRTMGTAAKQADVASDTHAFVDRIVGGTLDEKNGEVYVADNGFGGRIQVFDMKTGAFKRGWGAYGKPLSEIGKTGPSRGSLGADFGRHVTVALSDDGQLYAADRGGRRMQVFTRDGKFVKEWQVAPETGDRGSAGGVAFSPKPEQAKVLVPDILNNVVWVFDRKDGKLLEKVGYMGRNGGGFHWLHMLATDAQGNFYTGEVDTGRRVQRFLAQ